MTLHAKLSASGAHRWMPCPGSVKAESGIKDKSSSFAEEGTLAHSVADLALGQNKDCHEVCDDAEMAAFVQIYVDYVRSFQPYDYRYFEERVSFEEWVPGGFGTSDAIILTGKTIRICDLKYGKGVRIYAENNPQAMLYALGAYSSFGWLANVETVEIAIIQPRLDHISEWPISITDLLKWGEIARQKAEETEDPNAKRVPGEKQCRFCKAKGTCPALLKLTQDVILADFEDLTPTVAANKLTDDQMRKIMEAKSLIEAWLGAVEGVVKDRLLTDGVFPGFKMVEGRSVRKWIDEDIVGTTLQDVMGEEAYTKKLITPTQAEKILGKAKKEKLNGLIIKPRGAPALAPESDPRPSINLSDCDFEALDND